MASSMVLPDGTLHENVQVQQLPHLDDPAVKAWLARADKSGAPDLGKPVVARAAGSCS